MGRTDLLVFLILSGIFMVQSMAEKSENSEPITLKKSIADPPAVQSMTFEEGEHNDQTLAEAPVSRKLLKHNSSDKSVAGGGVIIGGLIAAIFAAVYCYIRVTRKKSSDGDDKH